MTISHAIYNISNYRKQYGFSKAIRAIIHYSYVALKKIKTNSSTNKIIKVNGYKLEVMTNDPYGTSSELLMFKSHEPVSTKLISKLLKKGMTCLDIGSNIGYYVLLESKIIGNEGKVIALEPSPENFRYLQNNIQLQNASNVQTFNIAAGDKDRKLRFLIYKEAANSCMIIPEGEEPRWPGKIIEVPVRRIDSLVDEFDVKKIDLIRMDVEGYEYHIFKGMKETLRKFQPKIQIEVHRNIMGKTNTKKLLQGLKDEGYEVKYYIPRDIDVPLIGTMKDVKKYPISKLLNMLELDSLPSFIMLTLENNGNSHNVQEEEIDLS